MSHSMPTLCFLSLRIKIENSWILNFDFQSIWTLNTTNAKNLWNLHIVNDQNLCHLKLFFQNNVFAENVFLYLFIDYCRKFWDATVMEINPNLSWLTQIRSFDRWHYGYYEIIPEVWIPCCKLTLVQCILCTRTKINLILRVSWISLQLLSTFVVD